MDSDHIHDATDSVPTTGGGPRQLDELVPEVYDELRRLAADQLRHERADHTLQTAGLVHEAYLRLSRQNRAGWQNRAQLLAIAARTMRRILVDHARAHRSLKRGQGAKRLSLDHVADWTGAADVDLLELDDALDRLAHEAPEQARVVEARFYGGLTYDEIAESLGVSVPTAKRRWKVARVKLFSMLVPEEAGGD